MTITTYDDLVQRSEEWYDVRRGIVTASAVGRLVTEQTIGAIAYVCPECAAPEFEPCISLRGGAAIKTMHSGRATRAAEVGATVVGVATGEEPRTLALLLASERITGWTEPTFTTSAMWRGLDDEPRAVEAYSQTWAPVRTCGFMVRDFDGHRIGYSPDGLVGDDGCIEIKSRAPKAQVKTVIAGEVPAENMAQIQCGLLVSGRQWCDYVSYAGGMSLWRNRIEPDPQWFDAILTAVTILERAVDLMVATYSEAVVGLPMTERVIPFDAEII